VAQTNSRVTDSETASFEPVATAQPFPWPPREGESAVQAFVTTWKESLLHPTWFFKHMPREDDYGSIVAYYLIVGVIAAGIHLFWHSVFNFSGIQELLLRAMGVKQDIPHSSGLMNFLFSPVVLLLALYVTAGLTHLFLKIVGGAHHGFDTTTRVVAFSYSPMLFAVVPFLGSLVGTVWLIVLTVIGLREAHETTTGRSVAAIFLPYAIIFGLFFLFAILALVFGLLSTRL
jgi:hypothetical protein